MRNGLVIAIRRRNSIGMWEKEYGGAAGARRFSFEPRFAPLRRLLARMRAARSRAFYTPPYRPCDLFSDRSVADGPSRASGAYFLER